MLGGMGGFGNLGDLLVGVRVDMGGLKQGLSKATDALRRSTREMEGSLRGIETTLFRYVSIPLKGLAASVVGFGSVFENEMTKSASIMRDVTRQMREDMSEAALEIGRTTEHGASTAASAFSILARSGFDVQQSIELLPEVADFATASFERMDSAASNLGQIMRALVPIMGEGEEQIQNASQVMEMLVHASRETETSVSQLAMALTQRAAAAVTTYDRSLEEAIAVMTVFGKRNIEGTRAAERYYSILDDLNRVIARNAEQWEDVLDVSLHADGALRDLWEILVILEESFGDMNQQQMAFVEEQLGLNSEVLRSIRLLDGASGEILRLTKEFENLDGEMSNLSDEIRSSFLVQLQMMLNQMRNIAVEIYRELDPAIGDYLTPVMFGLVNALQSVSDSFAEADGRIQALTVAALGLLALLAPIMVAVKALVVVLGTWGFALGAVAAGLGALVLAIASFRQAATLASRGTEEVVDSIHELEDSMEDAKNSTEEFEGSWGTLIGTLLGASASVGLVSKALGYTFFAAAGKALVALSAIGGSVYAGIGLWSKYRTEVGSTADHVAAALEKTEDQIKAIEIATQSMGETAESVFGRMGQWVRDAHETVTQGLGEGMAAAYGLVTGEYDLEDVDAVSTVPGSREEARRLRAEREVQRQATGADTIFDRLREGVDDALDQEFLNRITDLRDEVGQIDLDRFTETAEEAGQEIDRLRSRAERMREQLFPEEEMRSAISQIEEFSQKFPDIIDQEAVERGIEEVVRDFHDRGLEMERYLTEPLEGIPEQYRAMFEEAIEAIQWEEIEERGREMREEQLRQMDALRDESARFLQNLEEQAGGYDILEQKIEEAFETALVLGRDLSEETELLEVLVGDLWSQYIEGAHDSEEAVRDLENQLGSFGPEVRGILEDLIQGLRDADEAQRFDEWLRDLMDMSFSLETIARTLDSDFVRGAASTVRAIGVIHEATDNLLSNFEKFQEEGSTAFSVIRNLATASTGDILAMVAAVLEVADAFGLMGSSGERELSKLDEIMEDLDKALEDFGRQLEDLIVDFVREGKLQIQDLVDFILEELLRISIHHAIVEPITGAVRGMFDKGGAFSGGVQMFQSGGIVGGPMLFGHRGGLGLMGEKRAEAILPLERDSMGDLGVKAEFEVHERDQERSFNVVINNETGDPIEEADVRESIIDGERNVEITIKRVVESLVERGSFDPSLSRVMRRV